MYFTFWRIISHKCLFFFIYLSFRRKDAHDGRTYVTWPSTWHWGKVINNDTKNNLNSSPLPCKFRVPSVPTHSASMHNPPRFPSHASRIYICFPRAFQTTKSRHWLFFLLKLQPRTLTITFFICGIFAGKWRLWFASRAPFWDLYPVRPRASVIRAASQRYQVKLLESWNEPKMHVWSDDVRRSTQVHFSIKQIRISSPVWENNLSSLNKTLTNRFSNEFHSDFTVCRAKGKAFWF